MIDYSDCCGFVHNFSTQTLANSFYRNSHDHVQHGRNDYGGDDAYSNVYFYLVNDYVNVCVASQDYVFSNVTIVIDNIGSHFMLSSQHSMDSLSTYLKNACADCSIVLLHSHANVFGGHAYVHCCLHWNVYVSHVCDHACVLYDDSIPFTVALGGITVL